MGTAGPVERRKIAVRQNKLADLLHPSPRPMKRVPRIAVRALQSVPEYLTRPAESGGSNLAVSHISC